MHVLYFRKVLDARMSEMMFRRHCSYQEKSIFPSYKAKLNLTLFSLTNLIMHIVTKIIMVVYVGWLVGVAGYSW